MDNDLDTQTSYDRVAADYAEKFQDEMDDKPFDRACLVKRGTSVRFVDMGHSSNRDL